MDKMLTRRIIHRRRLLGIKVVEVEEQGQDKDRRLEVKEMQVI
jgi:hypothetical protein